MRERAVTNVSFRWPKTKADKLTRIAERNERSMAAEIRHVLDRHLNAEKTA